MDELAMLLEERAITRLLYDYSYALDMNWPQQMAALFVDDCKVSYAPNFAADGMEAYRKTLEGIENIRKIFKTGLKEWEKLRADHPGEYDGPLRHHVAQEDAQKVERRHGGIGSHAGVGRQLTDRGPDGARAVCVSGVKNPSG